MLKKIIDRHSCAVSALALVVSLASVTGASAASSDWIAGFADDGSAYLLVGYSSGAYTYKLVSTVGGSETQMEIPATAINVNGALSANGRFVARSYYDSETEEYTYSIWRDGELVFEDESTSVVAIGISDTGTAVGNAYSSTGVYTDAFVLIDVNGEYSQPLSASLATTVNFTDNMSSNEAKAISGDGSTVVGYFYYDSNNNDYHAFVWTLDDNTLTNIENDDPGFVRSYATNVSYDGSVVAGKAYTDTNSMVFRWTEAGGMLLIPTLENDGYMSITAMSDNGDVIVGEGSTHGYTHAYRYVANEGGTLTGTTTDLGTLGGNYSGASDASADGNYVVGTSTNTSGQYNGFRWSQETGMISIEEWLEKAGVTVDYSTYSARYVSSDGSVVIGYTDDDSVYVARVGTTSGIITPETFYPTVAAANNMTMQNSVSGANTIMFGAQGNPMRNLLSVGQRSVWGTVDSGYDDSDTASGGLALGEFGFGYGLADGVTARFSVGGTYTDQDLNVGGSVKQKGFYLSPEISADVGGNVYVTLGGYWSRSSVDAHRGYMNGSSLDYSNGDTDAETWGAKIRFDWLNALNVSNTDITPYVGISYARTTLDAYSETGGAFPVSYDETKDHSTIARLGADFVHPLTDTVRVLAKAEASYQFEDHSSATSGELIGISDFNLAGQDLKQFWVRGGVGAEFDVGGGTASFMVNATTQGQDPDVWVRSNFTVKF